MSPSTPVDRLVLRAVVAVLLAAQGAIHLQLWADGYRALPSIGPMFLVGGVIPIVLAVAVLVVPRTPVLLAGVAVSVGQLAALLLASTVGLFGFETMWTWGGDQGAAVWSEIAAIVALLTLYARRPAVTPPGRAA